MLNLVFYPNDKGSVYVISLILSIKTNFGASRDMLFQKEDQKNSNK